MVLTANRNRNYLHKYYHRKRPVYGGVRPDGRRDNLPIRNTPRGFLGALKRGARKATKIVKGAFKHAPGGIALYEGLMALIDLATKGSVNTPNIAYIKMAMAALTALQDARAIGRWIFSNEPSHEDEINMLSDHITALEELLAARVKFVNFGADPSPEQAGAIFARLAKQRGEPDDIADLSGEMVRYSMATGNSLQRAVSDGVQKIMEIRREQHLPILGYGFGVGTAIPNFAHFFDWLKPVIIEGYTTIWGRGLNDDPRKPNTLEDFCIFAAQKAWTMDDFKKGLQWFLHECGNFPQFTNPPPYPKPFGYESEYDPRDMYDASLARMFMDTVQELRRRYKDDPFFGGVSPAKNRYNFIQRANPPADARLAAFEQMRDQFINKWNDYSNDFIEYMKKRRKYETELAWPRDKVEAMLDDTGLDIPYSEWAGTLADEYKELRANGDNLYDAAYQQYLTEEAQLNAFADDLYGAGLSYYSIPSEGVRYYEMNGMGVYGGTTTAHRPPSSPTPTSLRYHFMNPDAFRDTPKYELVQWGIRDPDFREWAFKNGILLPSDFNEYITFAGINGSGIYDSELALLGGSIFSSLFNGAKKLVGKVYNGAKKLLS